MSHGASGDGELREFADGNAIWRILTTYGGSGAPQFALGTGASVVSRAQELIPAFILGVAVDVIFMGSGPLRLPFIPAAWIPTGVWGQIWFLTGILTATYAIGAGMRYVNRWAWNHFSQHLQHNIRTDAYDRMQALNLAFFDDRQTGEVMSVLNNDVNQLERFFTDRFKSVIRIIVRVGGMGIVMLLMNWQLALVPVFTIPLLAITSFAFLRILHPKYQRVRSTVGELNSRLENNIEGIHVIKAYNEEAFESERITESSREYLENQWDAISTRIKFIPTLRLITAAGFVATFVVGSIWVVSGPPWIFTLAVSPGMLVTFLFYSRRFMWPMRQLGQILNDYERAHASAERILGLQAIPQTITERPDAVDLPDVEGRVTFDDVRFRYGSTEAGAMDDDEWILDEVSFEAEPGAFVGVVGPTGAGKTTLVRLVMRLYDVVDGAVLVDGTDVREVSLESLRSAISYVSQDPYLFYGTVRENIAYGKPDMDDARIEEAARIAGAEEFIDRLPDGYDTMVGERGVKLSGGQRQRVALARAVLRDPAILILDEATSHVDNETEAIIQNSLSDLIADRTTFAVAHRLSTIRNADTILVLEDGELVEQGSHDELIEEDGLYATLWSVQVGEGEQLPEERIPEPPSGTTLFGSTDN